MIALSIVLILLTASADIPIASAGNERMTLPLNSATIDRLAQIKVQQNIFATSHPELPPPGGKNASNDLLIICIGAGAGAIFGALVDSDDGGVLRGLLIGTAAAAVYLFSSRF